MADRVDAYEGGPDGSKKGLPNEAHFLLRTVWGIDRVKASLHPRNSCGTEHLLMMPRAGKRHAVF